MLAVSIIIGLVAFVSIYDYLQSRNWQQVTSSVRNNVVFENRNRAYGAYAIRKDYERTLIIIMVCVVFSVGGIYAAYEGFRKLPIAKAIQAPVMQDVEIAMVLAPKDLPEEIPLKEVEPENVPETKQFVEPIVKDKENKNETKTQEELDGKKIGNNDLEKKGEEGGIIKKVIIEEPVKKKDEIIDNGPTDIVDIEAEYPGGIKAMMKFIQENLIYPQIGIEIGAQGKCYLRFVVDKEGRINSVKVMRGIHGCPECDKEAMRVLKSMPNWKPGKIAGKDVSSYFNLPIVFTLE